MMWCATCCEADAPCCSARACRSARARSIALTLASSSRKSFCAEPTQALCCHLTVKPSRCRDVPVHLSHRSNGPPKDVLQ